MNLFTVFMFPKFYSKMDMAKGYYQMQITAESREELLLAPLRVSFSLIKT